VPPYAGVFYHEPTDAALSAAVREFETLEADIRPAELQAHARNFSPAEFLRRMAPVLEQPARVSVTGYAAT
jgi:hypothetical protein